MSSWITQVLTSRDFWINFSVAVVFFLGGKFSLVLARTYKLLLQRRQRFSVTGFWIGTCALPSYQGRYSVEIWKLVQRRDSVNLAMFAYSPMDTVVDRCSGSGVLRGAFLSAIYYSCRRDSTESGVLALRTKGKHLVGSYAQYDPGHPDEHFFSSDGTYTLFRLKLPLGRAVKMLLGYPPFESFERINDVYENTRARIPQPTKSI
ncbi:MAG: hypothetical protein ABR589_11720 [Chthoniobacterales bacterium]